MGAFLQAIYFQTVGLKGDIKFLTQSLNLDRHPGKEEVGEAHMCVSLLSPTYQYSACSSENSLSKLVLICILHIYISVYSLCIYKEREREREKAICHRIQLDLIGVLWLFGLYFYTPYKPESPLIYMPTHLCIPM